MKLPRSVPPGRLTELNLAQHPLADRIGLGIGRGVFSEYQIKVFSHRKVLARCIRMQQRGPGNGPITWKAVVPLTDGEGY